MKYQNILILLVFFFFIQLLNIVYSQVNQEWIARYSLSSNPVDGSSEIISDINGYIYITGSSIGIGSNYDYATIKYSSSGKIEWVNRYNGPANGSDIANAIGLDSNGNIVVTGGSIGNGSGSDITTIKYSSLGEELWVSRYSSSGNQRDDAYAIAIDDSNNIYVTGESYNLNRDYVIIKYNSDGVQKWVRYYDAGNNHDIAYAIALDDSNNVYVTGESIQDTITFTDYATLKYNSNGILQWSNRYNGPFNGDDYANSIAIDSIGNVYVSGSIKDQFLYGDYAIIKYSRAGKEEWVKIYGGSSNFLDVPRAIIVDSKGNSYVTGYSTETNEGYDFTTIKYNSIGEIKWISHYHNGFNDIAFAITLDKNGNVYVTGQSDGNGTGFDCTTVKYDSTGIQQWVKRYDYSEQFGDYGISITIDNNSSVYVTGQSNREYLTIKYSQLTDVETIFSEVPKDFSLSQNYPNPFNPNTVISYELRVTSLAKLIVYDVLGNEVASLMNENKPAGSYEVEFDGSGFSSGIYFYSLSINGNVIDTKRMVLLK